MSITKEKWVVIDSGGRVMLKAVGEPQIICTLAKTPLDISPDVHARARLIAAAPDLLWIVKQFDAWVADPCSAEVPNAQDVLDVIAEAEK